MVNQIIKISTITPVYNGAKYIPDLVKELNSLKNFLDQHGDGLILNESIFVVDDAIDNSASILQNLSEKYKWVKVITLSRNYGQHPATIAGISHSSGDWIATLDEDLQHRPHFIFNLLKSALIAQSDISYASDDTVHKSIVRDFIASTFKKIVSSLVGNPYVKDFSSFRVIRGDIARATAAVCRHETYLDVALGWFSRRITTTNVSLQDDRNQSGGDSGYSFWGLIRHAKRMVMSSKLKIFRIGFFIGVSAFVVSILLSIYTIVSVIFKMDILLINKGWASLILATIFFGGLSVLLIAIVLESISDIIMNLNGKPTYFLVDRSNDKNLLSKIEQLETNIHLLIPN